MIGAAQLMVVLDITIVNVALPSAQESLAFSDASRQWVVTAYALAFGSLLLLGGRLGDLFGRKRVFITGLLGFATASAIGGAAGTVEMLIGARAAQGVFGALLAPAALSILTTTFTEPAERARAFGIFSAIAGGGAAIGLLLGGMLTEWASWRWCLYVNIAFAVPTALAAVRLLASGRPAQRPGIDIPGTILASSGLFFVVFGFSRAEVDGWGSTSAVASFVAALILLPAFLARQRVAAHPLLPLSVLLDRARGGAYLAMLVAGSGMFAGFLFLTYSCSRTSGFTPLQTGAGFPADDGRDHHDGAARHPPAPARIRPARDRADGHAVRRGGDARPHHALGRLELRRWGAAVPHRPGHRHGLHLRAGVPDGHARDCPAARWRRLGDGEYESAGRRVDRHRGAEHDRRVRDDRRDRGRRDEVTRGGRRRRDPRLHDGIRVDGRDLPVRRGGDEPAPAGRPTRACGRAGR